MKITANKQDMEQKLWDAAAAGDSATIRMLAMAGIDLDARNADGFTAFNIATMKGHTDTAMTIIAAREFKYAQKLGMTAEDYFGAGTVAPAKISKDQTGRKTG